MNTARAIFRNNELLRHLDSSGLDRVAQVATRRSYCGAATIYTHGDPADAVYGVIAGHVQLSARTSSLDEVFLGSYGSGRVFGVVSVIDGLQRCVTARAAPSAEVFVIARDHFLRLLASDSLLALSLLQVFCQHERITIRLITGEYALRSVPARLAHRVLELAGNCDEAGSSAAHAVEITQADLARYIFVSRQVVNHYLGEWQDRGWVSTSRRRVIVTDRKALATVASNGSGRG
jgi:CRP/FNR family transcriptional regulator